MVSILINLVNEFFLNFLFQLCGVWCYLFLPIRLYTIMHGFALLLGFICYTIDLLLYIFDASRLAFRYMYSFILSSDCNAWGVSFSSHKIGKCNKKNAVWYLNFVLRLVNYRCFVIFLMLCWLICICILMCTVLLVRLWFGCLLCFLEAVYCYYFRKIEAWHYWYLFCGSFTDVSCNYLLILWHIPVMIHFFQYRE